MNWYKCLVSVGIIMSGLLAASQETENSVSEKDPLNSQKKTEEGIVSVAIDSSKITDMGVAVSPSSMRFRTKPGKREVMYLTITNDTYKSEKFKMSFSDVTMNSKGKIQQVPAGMTTDKYGLVRWISVSPNFVELAPGEKKKIEVIIDLPDTEDAETAAWCLLMVDRAIEREYIVPEDAGKESIAMGIIPTYGFGVYIYQNPPNVAISKVSIEDFSYTYDEDNGFINMRAKNVGDGISYCRAYMEVNNVKTGYSERIPLKSFN
ncbi:DUF916 domain-containing protein, partial [Flavobacteriales bacterium]|nr:DUF916 domain-containing protein [Flavobacteriales bacterium]